ncbi:hypothetical protein KC356_g266 [Hortaea werneckii]|nr:hypothetical protein KC356_g266 [Hortaea werneckii]
MNSVHDAYLCGKSARNTRSDSLQYTKVCLHTIKMGEASHPAAPRIWADTSVTRATAYCSWSSRVLQRADELPLQPSVTAIDGRVDPIA